MRVGEEVQEVLWETMKEGKKGKDMTSKKIDKKKKKVPPKKKRSRGGRRVRTKKHPTLPLDDEIPPPPDVKSVEVKRLKNKHEFEPVISIRLELQTSDIFLQVFDRKDSPLWLKQAGITLMFDAPQADRIFCQMCDSIGIESPNLPMLKGKRKTHMSVFSRRRFSPKTGELLVDWGYLSAHYYDKTCSCRIRATMLHEHVVKICEALADALGWELGDA